MKTLKVVIFDFDGVLFDSWQSNYKIIKFISKFSNYKKEEILKMWGIRGELFIKIITQKFPWPLNYCIQKFIYWSWRLKEMRKNSKSKFFNDSLQVCRKLKNNGYLVGILTNRTSKTLKTTFKKLPNPPNYYFDFIQTHESSKVKIANLNCKNHICSKYSKPEVGAFVDFICDFLFKEIEKIRQKNNYYPKLELTYLGDTLTDLEFVKKSNENLNLKINFYGVLTGPLDNKEKWIQWSNGEIKEENILESINDLLNKLKIPS